MDAKPLVVICGPTASGKTGLSIELAKKYNGEIISADSRAIFRGLDIGTAKPTMNERSGIPHWGIDLVNPGDRFTAADFKAYALQKISDIRRRDHTPFLVGGTGLYIDSIVFDYQFSHTMENMKRRNYFDQMTIEELHVYCHNNNIKLPENEKNKRYVIAAIIRNNQKIKQRQVPIENCLIVGITTEKNILRQRIHDRAQMIFATNIIEETIVSSTTYGWDNEAMTGNIYPLIRQLVNGEITKEYAMIKFETLDWHLAKRQLTWLRRNPYIHWLSLSDAAKFCTQYLDDVSRL